MIRNDQPFLHVLRAIILFSLLHIGAMQQPVRAEHFILPLFDEDDQYFANLLQAAIEAADGDHTLDITYMSVSQNRVFRALLAQGGGVNVVYTGHSADRESLMRQIDIPLSRGLLGYRVFVIRPENASLFEGIHTLKDLKDRITVGSGTSWPDTAILRAAGFRVTSGSLQNLWHMLVRDRFIAFPRGMNEVHAELQRYAKTKLPEPVQTENTVMIHYPFDQFFYVAPEDQVRAEIIEQGLNRIYENGRFMEIFDADPAISEAREYAAQYKRKVIELKNPLNSDRVNQIGPKYWHRFDWQQD